ncbi:MAG: hypothetical protein Q4A77_06300 [Leptotrichia hongkongensis]|nr:hypothetical protein [Leptotrichia hongkongensis]
MKRKIYWTEKSINGNEIHGCSMENDDAASFLRFIIFFLIVLYRLIKFIVKRIIFVGNIIIKVLKLNVYNSEKEDKYD